MIIKNYKSLPQEARDIRIKVFIKEQGFQNEFDSIDEIAIHLVAFDENDFPIATCRVFKGENDKEYIFGRLAVVKTSRGQGIGAKMMGEAEKVVKNQGADSLILHAQVRAKEFYKKLGYAEFGEIEDDEGCPHIWMRKSL